MRSDRQKRLSIAEKRSMTPPLNLGPEYLEVDYHEIDPRPALEDDWTDVVVPEAPHKKLISLRVDPDVLEFFKARGPGYQTRMNAVLRAYMEAQVKRP
jgi:uncharacterized protein (DUF4415 family)